MPRLIDADALKLTFCRECTLRDDGCPEKAGGECDIQAVYHIEHLAPTIDAVPVVHGKWISDGDGYHWTYNCSICGWKDGYPFNERHNYCPQCGAKMTDGGDHDAAD